MRVKCVCWVGLAFYAFLSVLDWLLTFALLRLHPGAVESNPLAAEWLSRFGWHGLALYKIAGVLVFFAAVVLILRRKPSVAAVVVTCGCATLVWVTIYSHGLVCQAHREAVAEYQTIWPKPNPAKVANEYEFGAPAQCWFTSEPRQVPVRSAATNHPEASP